MLLNGGSLRTLKQQLHLSRKLHNWKKLLLPDTDSRCLLGQIRVAIVAASKLQYKNLRARFRGAEIQIDIEEQDLKFVH